MHHFRTNPPARQIPPRSAYKASTDILARIERHMTRTGIRPSRLGRTISNDPRLVFELRRGARLSDKRESAILNYLDREAAHA